jgi:hypothetical protein
MQQPEPDPLAEHLNARIDREEAMAIEIANADGIVEGLRRARTIVHAKCDGPLHDRQLHADIVRNINGAIAHALANFTPADLPHVDRAALLELATGWETEAKVDRTFADPVRWGEAAGLERAARDVERLLDGGATPGGGLSPERVAQLVASMLDHADALRSETHRGGLTDGSDDAYPNGYEQAAKDVACAAGVDVAAEELRRLLDAPRGGERVEAPREPTLDDLAQRLRREAEGQGRERAQDLAERWRRRASNPAAPSPVTAALEVCAFELADEFGLDPEGAAHEPCPGPHQVLEAAARDRVLGTSPPAAQDGSRVDQVATDEPRERNS